MMYLIGNLLGRFLASYILVLGVNLLASRFRPRAALCKTHSLWGGLAVGLVFLLGLLGHFG